MKQILKKIIPEKFHDSVYNLIQRTDFLFYNKTYSQEGEDMIIQRFWAEKKKGFYIDVGANHPTLYSNTKLLYKKGWNGINIEPYPGKINLFNKIRSKDINLGCGISDKEEKLKFHVFEESQISTFNKKKIDKKKKHTIIDVNCMPLSKVTNKFKIKKIDYLNIDTEGYEMKVLKGHNWSIKPTLISLEEHDYIKLNGKTEIFQFLKKKGYIFYARTNNTTFYLLKKNCKKN